MKAECRKVCENPISPPNRISKGDSFERSRYRGVRAIQGYPQRYARDENFPPPSVHVSMRLADRLFRGSPGWGKDLWRKLIDRRKRFLGGH